MGRSQASIYPGKDALIITTILVPSPASAFEGQRWENVGIERPSVASAPSHRTLLACREHRVVSQCRIGRRDDNPLGIGYCPMIAPASPWPLNTAIVVRRIIIGTLSRKSLA